MRICRRWPSIRRQPVVVVCIPKVGELSRKERDDNRPFFDASKGAKMIDDWKRLEKSFPEAVKKIRELVPARAEGEAEDLLVLVAGDAASHVKASDTKTQATFPSARFASTRRRGIFVWSWPGVTLTGMGYPRSPTRWSNRRSAIWASRSLEMRLSAPSG